MGYGVNFVLNKNMKEDGHSSEDEGFKPNSITVEKVKKGKETVGLKESPKDK